ncbi:MAG: leukotoxin LktA family filamentous adhesin [Cyanobacteriota bacterium]
MSGFSRKRRKVSKFVNSFDITKVISCLALACTVSLTPVQAQQIIIDGNTNTSLNINGSTTTVTTTTTKANNAFNSFSRFNVNSGNTVNLVVPDTSDNLINLIHDEATQIDGILNAIKNNEIGGNIFLVNPHGVTVGTEGIVNVGALTTITPTTVFMNNFFNAPGDPSDASINAIINGTAPINSASEINISGKINAITDVKLDSGSVNIDGDIYTGAKFEYDFDTGDFVNLNSAEYTEDNNSLNIVLENGSVVIKALGDIYQDGLIIAGENVELHANNVHIADTSFIYTRKDFLINSVAEIDFSGMADSKGDVLLESLTDNIFLNEGSIIRTTREINVNTPGTIFLDGTLETRGGYAYLKIFEDETIDPDSNIGATIFNGNIFVDPVDTFNFNGSDINLNGTVIGNGSLVVLNGPGEIDIINESINNIVTDELSASGGSLEGQIFINGIQQLNDYTNAGTNTDISVTIGGDIPGSSEIWVENKTIADIIIGGTVLTNNGLAKFYNQSGNILADSQTIISNEIILEASSMFNFASDDLVNFQYIVLINTDLNASSGIDIYSDGLMLSASELRVTHGGIDINTSVGTVLLPDISFYNYDTSLETIISGQIFADIAQHTSEFPDPINLNQTVLDASGEININSGMFFVDLFSTIQTQECFTAEGETILIGGNSFIFSWGDINLLALNNEASGSVMTFGMNSLADISNIFTDPFSHKPDVNDIMGFAYTPMLLADGSISIAAPINVPPVGFQPAAMIGQQNIRSIFNSNFDDMGLVILSNSLVDSYEDVQIYADAVALLDADILSVTGNIDIAATYGAALLPDISFLPDYFTDNSVESDFNFVRNYLDKVSSIFEQYDDVACIAGTYLNAAGNINIDQGLIFTSSYSTIQTGGDFSTTSTLSNFIGLNDISTGGDVNIFALNDDSVGAIFMLGLDGIMEAYGKPEPYTASPLFESITLIVSTGAVNLLSLDPELVQTNAQNLEINNIYDYFSDDLTDGHIVGMLDSSINSGAGMTITADLTALVAADNFNMDGDVSVVSSLGTILLPDFMPLFTYFLNPENAGQIIFPEYLNPVNYNQSSFVNAGNNVDIFSGILYSQMFSHVEANGTLTSDSVISAVIGDGLLIGWNNINFNALNSEDTGIILITGIEEFIDIAGDYLKDYGIEFSEPTYLNDYEPRLEIFCFEDININAGLFNGDVRDNTDPLKDLHIVALSDINTISENGDINITGDIIGILGTPVKTKYGNINLLSSTGTVLAPDIIPLLPRLIDKESVLSGDIALSNDNIKLFAPKSINTNLPSIIIDLEDIQNMRETYLNAGQNINIQSGILFADLFADLVAGNNLSTDSVATAIVGEAELIGSMGNVSINALNNQDSGLILMAGLTELIAEIDLYLLGQKIETGSNMTDYFGYIPMLNAGQNVNILSLSPVANCGCATAPKNADSYSFAFNEDDLPDANYTVIMGYDIYGNTNININGDIVGISSASIWAGTGDLNIDSTYATALLPDFISLFEYLNNDTKPAGGDLIIVDDIVPPEMREVPPEIMDLSFASRTQIKTPGNININTGGLYAQLFSDLETEQNVNINSSATTVAGDSTIIALNDININASNDSEIGYVVIVATESLIDLAKIYVKQENPSIIIPDDIIIEMLPNIQAGNNINITAISPPTVVMAEVGNEIDFLNDIPDGHYIAILDYNIAAGGDINITSKDFVGITGSFISTDTGNININSGAGTVLLPSYTLFMDDAMKSEVPVSGNIFLSRSIVNNQPILSDLIDENLPIISDLLSEEVSDQDFDSLFDAMSLKTNLMAGGNVTINSGIKFVNLFSDIYAGGNFTSTSVISMIGGDATILADGSVSIYATNHPQVGEITFVGHQYLLENNNAFPYFTPMIIAGKNINIASTMTTGGDLPLSDDIDDIFDLTLPEDSLVGIIGYELMAGNNINISGDYVAILDSNLVAEEDININTSICTIISPYYKQYFDDNPSKAAPARPMHEDNYILPVISMDFGDDNRSTLMAGNDIVINAGGIFALFSSDIATGDDFTSNSVLTSIIGDPQIMTGDDMDINASNNDNFGAIFIMGTNDFDLFDFDFDDMPILLAEDDIDLDTIRGSNIFPDISIIDSPGFEFYVNSVPSGLHMVGIFDSIVFAVDDLDIDADFVIIDDSFVDSGMNILLNLVLGGIFLPGEVMMASMFMPFSPIYPVIDPMFPFVEDFPNDPVLLPGGTVSGNNLISGSSINAQMGDVIINSGGTIANVFSTINAGNNIQINSSGNTLMLGSTTTSAGNSINMTTNTINLGTFANTSGLLSAVGFSDEIANYVQPDQLALLNSMPNETNLNASIDAVLQVNTGNINGGTIKAASGNIKINAPGGNVALDYISVPGTSQVIAGGNLIEINEIDPTIVDLRVLGYGGTINVNSGVSGQLVNLTGDNIFVNFNDGNSSDPLTFNVSGSNGLASNVNITAGSSQGLVFSSLNSNNATINNSLQNTSLTLYNTIIGNQFNLNSDRILATNNINLNNVSLLGYSGGTAYNVVVSNNGNLNVTQLNTINASISTTGPDLYINNAIVTGSANFANNTYTAIVDNTGNINVVGADIILSSNGTFMLDLNAYNDISTDASVLAAIPGLDITGAIDSPEINNDINQTSNTAEDKIYDILNDSSKNNNESNLLSSKELLEVEGSILYKDSYVIEILNEAVEIYNNSIATNVSEEDALKKASAVLKKANFDIFIVKQLLKYSTINNNSTFVKILNGYSTEISIK